MQGNVERVKSASGQAIAVGMGVLLAVGAVLTVADEGVSAVVTVWPWLALVGGVSWAVYWRPEVQVSDGGVRIVNVTRTIDVPWPALQEIDTKWALTLHTVWGRYRAWAAPAPGRSVMRRQLREQDSPARAVERRVPGLPAATWGRPADLPEADSGAAAALVNTRWQRLRQAGHLDGAVVEQGRAPMRWHWELLAGAAALTAIGVAGIVI